MTPPVRIRNGQLVDNHARTLLLRGVNLGGSSKVPAIPAGGSWNPAGFLDHRNVSFVGRPFPLAEADGHYRRLKDWGFTLLRFLVPWEAIEHAGPGIYDQEYLDYLAAVIRKAGEHGFLVFIDPHQDVWSRFTGGDGAPGWTLELAGLDPAKFKATGAAIVHATHGDPFPPMIWPTNGAKYANLTMWTLFFGGNDFAPRLRVDGVPIQEFLQSHFIAAFREVAGRLRGLANVVGFDSLNEPLAGLIGLRDIRLPVGPLRKGDSPTAWQAMLLAAGFPQEVETWNVTMLGLRRTGSRMINAEGVSCFREGVAPIWRSHGVWDADSAGHPRLLRPDYFAACARGPVDFYADYFKPFINRYIREVRSILPDSLLFLEGISEEEPPAWGPADAANVVHAAHWYDGMTLMMKRHIGWLGYDAWKQRIVLGRPFVRRSFRGQIAHLVRHSHERMNGAPLLVGETGVPMDLGGGRAYRDGDFSAQTAAMDDSMQAVESNCVGFTIWDYTADNTNARGDGWNGEDFSIYSRDQEAGSGDPYDGGRALAAAIRPYARAVAGTPLRQSFDLHTGIYRFSYRADPAATAPTEIFLPRLHFPDGVVWRGSGGRCEVDDTQQLLRHYPEPIGGECRMEIFRK